MGGRGSMRKKLSLEGARQRGDEKNRFVLLESHKNILRQIFTILLL